MQVINSSVVKTHLKVTQFGGSYTPTNGNKSNFSQNENIVKMLNNNILITSTPNTGISVYSCKYLDIIASIYSINETRPSI